MTVWFQLTCCDIKQLCSGHPKSEVQFWALVSLQRKLQDPFEICTSAWWCLAQCTKTLKVLFTPSKNFINKSGIRTSANLLYKSRYLKNIYYYILNTKCGWFGRETLETIAWTQHGPQPSLICLQGWELSDINTELEILQYRALTPTFRKRSPTMLSADILAEGVRGLVPNPFGIAANKHVWLCELLCALLLLHSSIFKITSV